MNPHLESRSKDSVFEVWLERWWFQPFFFKKNLHLQSGPQRNPVKYVGAVITPLLISGYQITPDFHPCINLYGHFFRGPLAPWSNCDPNSFHFDKDFFWVVLLQKAGVETTKMRPRCLKTVTKSGKSGNPGCWVLKIFLSKKIQGHSLTPWDSLFIFFGWPLLIIFFLVGHC